MNKNDEMILVSKRKNLFEGETLTWQGATKDSSLISKIMKNLHNTADVTRRGEAEENKEYKQPIPYMILKRGTELFMYERLQGGGENRLHNKLSLGVGGHMNDLSDVSFEHDLLLNTMRELEEEVKIKGKEITTEDVSITALINDDKDEVGKVHLGLLGVIELPEGAEVTVIETEQLAGTWVQLEQLKADKAMYDRLENWSKIYVDMV